MKECQLVRRKQERLGQTLIEYALIVMLVSLVAIIVLGILGVDLRDFFNSIPGILFP